MTAAGVVQTRLGRVLELEMSNPAARNALLREGLAAFVERRKPRFHP